jgi:hypothetical protein
MGNSIHNHTKGGVTLYRDPVSNLCMYVTNPEHIIASTDCIRGGTTKEIALKTNKGRPGPPQEQTM